KRPRGAARSSGLAWPTLRRLSPAAGGMGSPSLQPVPPCPAPPHSLPLQRGRRAQPVGYRRGGSVSGKKGGAPGGGSTSSKARSCAKPNERGTYALREASNSDTVTASRVTAISVTVTSGRKGPAPARTATATRIAASTPTRTIVPTGAGAPRGRTSLRRASTSCWMSSSMASMRIVASSCAAARTWAGGGPSWVTQPVCRAARTRNLCPPKQRQRSILDGRLGAGADRALGHAFAGGEHELPAGSEPPRRKRERHRLGTRVEEQQKRIVCDLLAVRA